MRIEELRNKIFLGFVLLFITTTAGCGKEFLVGPSGLQGNVGSTGPQGPAGLNGASGTDGSNCSVTLPKSGCVFVVCTDGTRELIKGTEKKCE